MIHAYAWMCARVHACRRVGIHVCTYVTYAHNERAYVHAAEIPWMRGRKIGSLCRRRVPKRLTQEGGPRGEHRTTYDSEVTEERNQTANEQHAEEKPERKAHA